MNDKIQWFKEFYRLDRFTNPNEPYLPSATDISYDDLLWLVEQAEEAERLQQENEILWNRVNSYSDELHKLIEQNYENEQWFQKASENVARLENELQQTQAKAERYEKALKEIIEGEGARLNFIGESNSEALEIAQQALEGDSHATD
jgi:uncharacterized protein YigA (DUF484 family)